jgi:dTDP-4-dehydrorhamnose reductase
MKVVVLGVSGLIGHKLFQVLSQKFETFGTIRGVKKDYSHAPFFENKNIIENVDAFNMKNMQRTLNEIDPDVVLNCIGITKRKKEINNHYKAIYVNSLFPHMLAEWSKKTNKRVIHFSTDCVFNGVDGDYTEDSNPNAEDMYGKTKALGEINYNHTLTIRSSFVGRELFSHTEILDWFLLQQSKVIKGYTDTLYTGVSTLVLSRIVSEIIEHHPRLCGLRQLAIEKPVSKFDLLNIAKKSFDKKTEIIPDENISIYANLNGKKLQKELAYELPSWEVMMDELANDELCDYGE